MITQNARIEHMEMGVNVFVAIAQIMHSVFISLRYVWMDVNEDT